MRNTSSPSVSPGEAWEEIMAVMASTFEGPFPRAYTALNMGGLLVAIIATVMKTPEGEWQFDLKTLADEATIRMDPAVKRAIMSLSEGINGWVEYVVADAVASAPEWPKAWVLPLGTKSIKRMLRALHAAGATGPEAREFFKRDPRVAKEARGEAIRAVERTDVQEWFALGVKGEMPDIRELPTEEAEGPGPNEFKAGGITWLDNAKSQGLPAAVREWLAFVEEMVKTRGQGILTLAATGRNMVMDVQYIEGNVRYGQGLAHKALMDAFILGRLGEEEGVGAVLRLFTGEKDDLIGEPIKEVRHWFIASEYGQVKVEGIEAALGQRNHETDAKTGEALDPEFGVVFCDSPSFGE